MYVRLKSYEASAFSDHVMPYRCVHCHHETTARAFAYAKGVGLSPYGLDDHGAEARADRHARANAATQAALSIRIASSPPKRTSPARMKCAPGSRTAPNDTAVPLNANRLVTEKLPALEESEKMRPTVTVLSPG